MDDVKQTKLSSSYPRGGVLKSVLKGCAAQGLKSLPISKDFSPSKNGLFEVFFQNFSKLGPITKGFSASKIIDFTIFSTILVKWDPLLRVFLD